MAGSSLRRIAHHLRKAIQREKARAAGIDTGPTLKSALIGEAALARGFTVTRLDSRVVLVEAGGRMIPFSEMNGPDSSVVGRMLCDNKDYARRLLKRAGLPVVVSALVRSSDESLAFVREVGFPVVVKPLDQAQGRGVTTDITTERALRAAYARASVRRREALVEQQFEGDDFRFFVVADEVVSVTSRVRAKVVGDGVSAVQVLIERKNELRRQNRYLADYPIPLELGLLTTLVRAGRTLKYVPAEGEHVQLRDQSNLSAGGDSIDVTDECHPSFKDAAIRAVAAITGMAYAGVDILTPSVTEEASAENYIVGEVEYSPAALSMFPVVGQPRDMAGAILEYYVGSSL